jgi:hypothetical protein
LNGYGLKRFFKEEHYWGVRGSVALLHAPQGKDCTGFTEKYS